MKIFISQPMSGRSDVDIEQVSVCEDEDTAYEYWKLHFNPNPADCCDLRM